MTPLHTCIPSDGGEYIFTGARNLTEVQHRATLPVWGHRTRGGLRQQWGQSSRVCVPTAASEGAKATRRAPPGRLRAKLIQLLFQDIFLPDLLSSRSVFTFPSPAESLQQLVPDQLPPGTGRKAKGSKAVRNSQIKVAPSLLIVSITDYSHE